MEKNQINEVLYQSENLLSKQGQKERPYRLKIMKEENKNRLFWKDLEIILEEK